MMIDDIAEKIIESRNNDIAKAFTMHIGSLLLNNGIVPVMTEYTGNDVKNITDTNEYKLVMEYGVAFKELDCSKHDKEIYNKAIDDFVNSIKDELNRFEVKNLDTCVLFDFIDSKVEQLKTSVKNEN